MFTTSLLGAQHKKDSVKNKPASLLVVSSGKILIRLLPSLCGKQVAGPSSLFVVVAQSDWKLAKRANEKLIIWEASPKIKDLPRTKENSFFAERHRGKQRIPYFLKSVVCFSGGNKASSTDDGANHCINYGAWYEPSTTDREADGPTTTHFVDHKSYDCEQMHYK